MKIRVESAWAGKAIYQLLTFPDGSRERINRERWDRKTASEALDLLERVYHIPRRNVRFDVR